MALARTFAQYLHCEHPVNGEPCNECAACRLHREFNHPDLHFVYPVIKVNSNDKPVSTDYWPQFHDFIEKHPDMSPELWSEAIKAGNRVPQIYVFEADQLIIADAYPAYSAKYKVFIIWLPERMNPSTANKLLKVLEEPSEGTLFLFVCDNSLTVLPTILSRTQRIHIASGVERSNEEEQAELEQFRNIYQEVMRMAYSKKPGKLKQLSETIAGFGREKACRYLIYANRMARENFLYSLGNGSLISLTPEENTFSQKFHAFIHAGNIEDMVAETDKARCDIERNANAKIVLFDYFIRLIILIHRKRPAAV
jgi:DNA polymerase-3 subunit delta'